MAIRIILLAGTEPGTQFLVRGPDVRIGNSAPHAVRLTDNAWPGGSIRILRRLGGYVVINDTPAPLWLDRQPLSPAQPHTLHDLATLQPTPHTVMQFRIEHDPPGTPLDGVERIAPPPPPKSRRGTWLLAAITLGLAAWLFAAPHGSRVPEHVRAEARAIKQLLAERKHAADPGSQHYWDHLDALLRDALYEEAMGRPHNAHQHYIRLRDELAAPHGNRHSPEAHGVLERARQFVKSRLQATAPANLLDVATIR